MRPYSPNARARVEFRPLPWNVRIRSWAVTAPNLSEPATRGRSSQLRAMRSVLMRWRAMPFSGP
jgi:hypothetical protein